MPAPALKTIAVHLPVASLCEPLLGVAIPLAEAHGALVVGLHVAPAVVIYADASVAMSTEFVVAQQEEARQAAQAAEAGFRARLEAAGLGFEWRGGDAGDEPTMRAVATFCNTADLVVASQYHEGIPAAAGYSPDDLVLGTGRPVLIVPSGGVAGPIGRNVVIGWNGSREAARAAFDCLPLLQAQAEVRLVAIDSPRGDASLAAMAGALRRLGVEAAPLSLTRSGGRSVADELLGLAAECGADLVVAGCYGHSRLRETVFGGASASLLRDMERPVLMAH